MKKAKGSLTLETALVLPIFLSLAVSMISILEMMNLYARAEFALHETAREIALTMYPVKYVQNAGEELFDEELNCEIPDKSILNPLISETVVRTMFTEKFGFKELNDSMISNSEAGIHFFRSDVVNEKGDIDLIITYKTEPLFNLFGIGSMTFSNRTSMHSWMGYVSPDDEDDGEYVYITENASVYHTRRECTHLCLSVNTVQISDLDKYRSSDGSKYRKCSKCFDGETDDDTVFVFITPNGDAFHSSLSCSGLKRSVYKVRRSEVSNLNECERCAGYVAGKVKEEDEE